MKHEIEINTPAYNERRYGKPYIATISFLDPRGTPTWGNWVGRAGDAGLLVITVNTGDIVMKGQRDNRNMKYSAPDYGQVCSDGSIDWFTTKAEAYKAWRAVKSSIEAIL